MQKHKTNTSDVLLIGAGIMSATLGTLLKELMPEWSVTVFESLSGPGEESSNEWNNAGTGHSALCELNYTPERPDGSIDIKKALDVNEQFQVSRQFWSYLVKEKIIHHPEDFIRPLPHISFVQGKENVEFLKKRYEALTSHFFFQGMEFSDNHNTLSNWIPLAMNGRHPAEPIAATKIDSGTDVNFGDLTRKLFEHLKNSETNIHYNHRVLDLKRLSDGFWEVKVKNSESGTTFYYRSKFVFIGSGGASLPLLQKSGIPESKQIGGFPVSGLFLVCNNPDVVKQHHSKVYGKAKVGAPPMSVPHLDTRYINGKQSLLFGPFAGFSPKFLKNGSMFDLICSVKPNNFTTMLSAGIKNMSLTKYLISQVLSSKEKRMNELREFVPSAEEKDWDLIVAGQRVQIIKDTEEEGKGSLRFGTEVINSSDGTIAALLGASPGASTAVHVMIELLEKCFPDHIDSWETKLKEIVPTYSSSLSENQLLFDKINISTNQILGL